MKRSYSNSRWYNSKLFIHFLLILFFPLGILALWRTQTLATWWKIVATCLTLITVFICFGPYDSAEYRKPTYSTDIHQQLGLKQKEIQSNNCQITYWIKDNNKESWIIFLHGAGADHRMFLEQVKAIDNYNLLLIDGRGQGKSEMIDKSGEVVFTDMIDDVMLVMDANDIDKPIVIAQSLGASVAQEIAFQYPDRVQKMVLIGCYSHHEETGSAWRVRNFAMNIVLKIVPWSTLVEKFGEMTSEYKNVRDYTVGGLITAGRDNWQNLGMTAYEHKHQVESYQKPHETLLIRGEHDYPEMLSGIYVRMMAKNPLAREVVVSDSGHLCNMENVADVNHAILDFIK